MNKKKNNNFNQNNNNKKYNNNKKTTIAGCDTIEINLVYFIAVVQIVSYDLHTYITIFRQICQNPNQ